jgi:hypothetical protein
MVWLSALGWHLSWRLNVSCLWIFQPGDKSVWTEETSDRKSLSDVAWNKQIKPFRCHLEYTETEVC